VADSRSPGLRGDLGRERSDALDDIVSVGPDGSSVGSEGAEQEARGESVGSEPDGEHASEPGSKADDVADVDGVVNARDALGSPSLASVLERFFSGPGIEPWLESSDAVSVPDGTLPDFGAWLGENRSSEPSDFGFFGIGHLPRSFT
jgi:hypothetical protein